MFVDLPGARRLSNDEADARIYGMSLKLSPAKFNKGHHMSRDASYDPVQTRLPDLQNVEVMQRLHDLLRRAEYGRFRRLLSRVEFANELSQFYVLSFHALLAMIERSEFVSDYLEMAEAMAGCPYERAVAAENWATYHLCHDDPSAAALRCLSTLADVAQTEGLWCNFLIALDRMGDTEMIDATLSCFAIALPEISDRLVRSFSAQPSLREVRDRPAYRELLQGRWQDGGVRLSCGAPTQCS